MKKGVRAVGVAESYRGEGGDSYVAGAVVRADGIVEGFRFTTIAVGGTDATDGVVELYDAFDRDDMRFVLVSGVAPAWYNIVDLRAVHEEVDVPVISVTYEEGDEDGLRTALEDEFDGDALDERLALYDSLPQRRRIAVGDDRAVYVRSVGVSDDRADGWIRGFTRSDEGSARPEPVRVARLAARGLLDFVDDR